MNITFLGAAGEVTGSQHLLETSHRRLLLDCGFFQGPRAESRRKNETFLCDPKRLDAVILSHAHIDHCGSLPRLRREGFKGPVFCTDATADLAELMLRDSAKIQEEDARYLTRKLAPGHPPIEPLYTQDDVELLIRQFEPCPFDEWVSLSASDDVRVRFSPAGHILGSAIVELDLRDGADRKLVAFTGDLGRRAMPLLKDPAPLSGAYDALICESTYGDRVHPDPQNIGGLLINIFREAQLTGGRVVIPAFALGRTQQILYVLNDLFNAGQLPRLPIFVDSPLANRVTQLFQRYQHTLDGDVQKLLIKDPDPFGFDHLRFVQNQQESMQLNKRKGAFVVIAASGMCESGRVVHHLKHTLTEEKNTVLLMGYQAPRTLGRRLADREPVVKLFGREYPVRANVLQLDGLSAHADVVDLKWWFEESTRRGHFGRMFLVHGEPRAASALATIARDYADHEPIIPQRGETFEV